MSEALSFSEALGLCLELGAVEIRGRDGEWHAFWIDASAGGIYLHIELLRRWAASEFRRARPRRSRVGIAPASTRRMWKP